MAILKARCGQRSPTECRTNPCRSESNPHFRSDDERIRDSSGAARTDDPLDVRLDERELGQLNSIPRFDDRLVVRVTVARRLYRARIVATKLAVDQPERGLVVVASRNQTFVDEPDVDLEWHDRDARLRIETRGRPNRQTLVTPGRLLIYHLVAMDVESIGSRPLVIRPELGESAPRRERSPHPIAVSYTHLTLPT